MNILFLNITTFLCSIKIDAILDRAKQQFLSNSFKYLFSIEANKSFYVSFLVDFNVTQKISNLTFFPINFRVVTHTLSGYVL